MKTLRIIALASLVALLAAPAGAAEFKMRLSHQLPESHHIGVNVSYFKKLVEEKTAGRVEVQIYPAAQAFKPKEALNAVVAGGIEAAVTTNFEWAGMLPIMDVVLIPWLVTDLSLIEKVLTGEAGAKLFQAMASKGVVPLMWFVQCRTNLYTSNAGPLLLPKDFQGKKMRGTSKIMNLGSEAMGSSTMAISGPEAYMALQRGTIDIGLTGIDAALARHYYEIQKYGTVVNNFSVIQPLFLNPKFWNSLPADTQKAIKGCAVEVQKKSLKDSETARTEAIEGLQKKMTIHIQTKDEENAWKAAMQKPVLDYFLQKTGNEGKELVDLINKLGK